MFQCRRMILTNRKILFDGTLRIRLAVWGDSDPVLYPYTTAEPHGPVGKSLRATFDGLLSGRLLVALMDEI